jgi:hypothetical protein
MITQKERDLEVIDNFTTEFACSDCSECIEAELEYLELKRRYPFIVAPDGTITR